MTYASVDAVPIVEVPGLAVALSFRLYPLLASLPRANNTVRSKTNTKSNLIFFKSVFAFRLASLRNFRVLADGFRIVRLYESIM